MGFPVIIKHDGLCHANGDEKDTCRMFTWDPERGMHCGILASAVVISNFKSLEACNKIYGRTYEGDA